MKSPARFRTRRSRWQLTNLVAPVLDKVLFQLPRSQLWSVLGANGHVFGMLSAKYSYLKQIGIRRRAKYVFILKTLVECQTVCNGESDLDMRVFHLRWARSVIMSASEYCK